MRRRGTVSRPRYWWGSSPAAAGRPLQRSVRSGRRNRAREGTERFRSSEKMPGQSLRAALRRRASLEAAARQDSRSGSCRASGRSPRASVHASRARLGTCGAERTLESLRRLRGEVLAEVRLVPDLPEAHARERRHRRRRTVAAAVASSDCFDELPVITTRRAPLPIRTTSPRRTGADRPQRSGTRHHEVNNDAIGLCSCHDRVVPAPAARGIVGRVSGGESPRPAA